MRYFRSDESTYEQVRTTLDSAWGLPDEATATVTCMPPATQATRDTRGRCMVAVPDEFCGFSTAAELLPQLLASGVIQEITQADYTATMYSPEP